jgi:DNA polymerase I-like protein with 3'-5' exonuclease and polymerase domains
MILHPPTFNAAFKVAGTASFRLASTQFLKTRGVGYGGNLQNIPDEQRRVFVPRPGNVFVQCDLEGAEAVAVALLVPEGNFRQLVRLGIKIHNYLCIKLFPELFVHLGITPNLTPAELKNHPNYKAFVKFVKSLRREYDLAKRTVHGSNYGMAWKTFQETVLKGTRGRVVLTAAEAKRFLAIYFEVFPEIKFFQIGLEEAVKNGVTIRNLFGHPVVFTRRFTTDLARTGISWIPQSTVGQCSNIAARKLDDYIREYNKPWIINNIVHDSILDEGPAAAAQELAAITASCLSFTFKSPLDGWECTIGVEKQIGRNWGKYDETENPDGMKVIA